MATYEAWPAGGIVIGLALSRSWPLDVYPDAVDIDVLREVAAAHWQAILARYGFELSEPAEDTTIFRHVPNVGSGTHFRSSCTVVGLLPGDREGEGQ